MHRLSRHVTKKPQQPQSPHPLHVQQDNPNRQTPNSIQNLNQSGFNQSFRGSNSRGGKASRGNGSSKGNVIPTRDYVLRPLPTNFQHTFSFINRNFVLLENNQSQLYNNPDNSNPSATMPNSFYISRMEAAAPAGGALAETALTGPNLVSTYVSTPAVATSGYSRGGQYCTPTIQQYNYQPVPMQQNSVSGIYGKYDNPGNSGNQVNYYGNYGIFSSGSGTFLPGQPSTSSMNITDRTTLSSNVRGQPQPTDISPRLACSRCGKAQMEQVNVATMTVPVGQFE